LEETMIAAKKRAFMTAAIAGVIFTASAALGGCAGGPGAGSAQFTATGNGYYSGDLFVAGTWRSGQFRYRDYGGRRQYMVGGNWRDGQTRDERDRNDNRDRNR
jgi:hypothetical protein